MIIIELFQYSFIIRAFQAGIIVAIIAPMIGIFLVLRRYSLIADTLAHVSLAGVSLGFFLGLHPIFSAIGTTLLASLGIEKLRASKKVSGDSALAIFLSGSLALSLVIFSLSGGLNTNIFQYLFGSILTVTTIDIYIITVLAAIVAVVLFLFFKELIYTTFDEDSAKVSGIPVKLINAILIILSAFTVSLAIPIVGVLLIAALIVIPVVSALQLKKSFFSTIILAEIFSITSVVAGIFLSFYLNISTSGTIILIMIAILILTLIFNHKK